jgi:thymidylate synthase
MAYLLEPYDNALQEILDYGIEKKDRTGIGTISVAGLQRKYPLHLGGAFPIVTGRKMFPKSVWAELLWFISGSTMNQDLEALGAKFWGKWCDENNPKYRALREKYGYEPGDFGPIYGFQLRHFGADYLAVNALKRCTVLSNRLDEAEGTWGYDYEAYNEILGILRTRSLPDELLHYFQEGDIDTAEFGRLATEELAKGFDQLKFMINILKNDPYGSNGRRCLFSLWNPNDLEKMSLPPCHFTYQAIADGNGGLTGILTQRSCDEFIGIPANIQFYSALTIMLAQQSGLTPREFIHNMNDAHIYLNHVDAVKEYLSRPKPPSPRVMIRKAADIYSYKISDFEVSDYDPLDPIKVDVAV